MNCNIVVFMTVCTYWHTHTHTHTHTHIIYIYIYIYTTALYYGPNTTGMTHLKINAKCHLMWFFPPTVLPSLSLKLILPSSSLWNLLTDINIKRTVFWDTKPTYLRRQLSPPNHCYFATKLHGVTSCKTVIFAYFQVIICKTYQETSAPVLTSCTSLVLTLFMEHRKGETIRQLQTVMQLCVT